MDKDKKKKLIKKVNEMTPDELNKTIFEYGKIHYGSVHYKHMLERKAELEKRG